MNVNQERVYIGLDVGESRIGVARVHSIVQIAEPLAIIDATKQDVCKEIQSLVVTYQADGVVVGLPRGLDGQETAQTQYCQEFALKLKECLAVPVYMIDEAGTSKEADTRLSKGSQISRDSMAAAILLEDFIAQSEQEELEV
jgi:putative holliday junction resolvase